MSWLRLYNGDFVRMLPWTVLMDELTNQWSLEDAGEVYPEGELPGPYDGRTLERIQDRGGSVPAK